MATIQEAIQNLRLLRHDIEDLAARLNTMDRGMSDEMYEVNNRAGEVLVDLEDIITAAVARKEKRRAKRRERMKGA